MHTGFSRTTTGELRGSSEAMPTGFSRTTTGLLGIDIAHVTHVTSLPFHHRDPFDRLLVAQSLIEGLMVLSDQSIFDDCGVLRIWPSWAWPAASLEGRLQL